MDTDVIIVGAGPTGLMLAGELQLGGARVTIVERLAEPTGQSRGLGFTARAMEEFDQRGLLSLFAEMFSALETSPWLTIWNTAPCSPCVLAAKIPMVTKPMCATEE